MKVLNIDQFATPKRQLTLSGKTYPVRDFTVQAFIDNVRQAEAIEGEKSIAKQVDLSVAMVKQSVPDVPEEELRALSLEQLGMVLSFIRGDMDDKASEEGGDQTKKPA